MIDDRRKIVEYFKNNLKKGYTLESLKWALVRQGYSRAAVELAAEKAQHELAEKAPVLKEKPKIRYEILDEFDRPVEIKKSWWKFW